MGGFFGLTQKRNRKSATILFCYKSFSMLNQWYSDTIIIEFHTLFAKSSDEPFISPECLLRLLGSNWNADNY